MNRRRFIVSTRIPREQLAGVDTVEPVVSLSSQRNGGLRRRLRVQTADERHAMSAHVKRAPDRRKAWEDILWALLNSKEFLLRH